MLLPLLMRVGPTDDLPLAILQASDGIIPVNVNVAVDLATRILLLAPPHQLGARRGARIDCSQECHYVWPCPLPPHFRHQ
jgi:hypothetical protein